MGKSILKNKRGISIDKLFLLELFLAIVVSAGILYYVYSVSTDTLFEKKVITRDLSMLSNTIQSVPGNVYYEYTPSKKKLLSFFGADIVYDDIFSKNKPYNFEFSGNMILISEEVYSKLGYPYFINHFLDQGLYSLPNAKKISLTNFNHAFVVSSQPMVGLKYETKIIETPSTGFKVTTEPTQKDTKDAKLPTLNQDISSSQQSDILDELEKEQMTEQITD